MKAPWFNKGAVLSCLILSITLTAGFATAAVANDPDPDRYIVSFLDVGKGKAALRAAGARIELELTNRESAAVHIPSQALRGLQRNPHIEYIEPDMLRFPMAQTVPWGIPAVQAHMVSDSSAVNRKVCIIDSGYSLGHEDLSSGNNVDGESGTNWHVDTCFHGTHVAGTIAALNNEQGVVGVLPSGKIQLHIVKVFDGANCAWSYSSSLIAALDECESAGANVVSMSLGGGFKSRTEERAFRDAYNNKGILSVAAAGNDGNTRNSYPASYDSVISVAAVDSAKVVADFSQQNSQVELAGPGVAVRSTVGMGDGLEESLVAGGTGFEVTGMDGSFKGSATAPLHQCSGLGNPGDCAGASGKICVISRGGLTFAEKVLECQAAGGVAAIIVNNAPALFSGTLGGTVTKIPSVGIAGADATSLAEDLTATVTVLDGNYAFYDGTSMATPHVSGVAALLWSQDTSCTNSQIRDTLASKALDLGPKGRDVAYGYGLVQLADASAVLNCSGDSDSGGDCGLPAGASCSSDGQCCSGTCKGKPGVKSCK